MQVLKSEAFLSAAELEELGALLQSGSIDCARGALTAIASVPQQLSPDQWLPDLVAAAALDEPSRAAAATRLLSRLQEQVNAILFHDLVEELVPPADQLDGVRAFCQGYADVLAVLDLQEEPDEVLADLFAIELLAGRVSDDEVEEVLPPGATRAQYVEEASSELAGMVSALYTVWEAARRRLVTVRREEPKIGRNDPCSCGSGKKFKKCCA